MQRWRHADVWPHEEAAKEGATESLGLLFKGTWGRGKEKEVLFWAQLSPGSIWHCPPAFRGPQVPSLCVKTDTRICQTDTCLDQYGVHRSPEPLTHPSKATTGTSFSLTLHQQSQAWRYETRETKVLAGRKTRAEVLKKRILPTNPPIPQKEGQPVSSERLRPSLSPLPLL